MRLKKLLLSGFKSFVDSTDIRLPSHLVGVVGPNGCGKSNVIDAVRWVMGETSAKMLRGDNMADVIFNGSSSRKPVGKASVELLFDNSDGKAPGNYGKFAEISIKRTLTREGQSTYHINNLKTRRKDVLDLFHGTGLGPRSYSLIEQGMVGKIVEARPEELRLFVEEAAGTSRYKDRRRETATKIAHTRDNLERVADIRDELGKQLRRLKRQSTSAHRYKALKQQERELNGQIHALKLNDMEQNLSAQERATAKSDNELEAALAQLREKEAALENLRKEQSEINQKNSVIQQEFYQVGASITNIEQKIEYQKESSQRQSEELLRLEGEAQQRLDLIATEQKKSVSLEQTLRDSQPQLEESQRACADAESKLMQAEKVLQEWQREIDVFNEQSRTPAQQQEIQKSRIAYLMQTQEKTAMRESSLRDRLNTQTDWISAHEIASLRKEVEDYDARHEREEAAVHATEEKIKAANERLEQLKSEATVQGNQQQQTLSRLKSLKEIQRAMLGGDDDTLKSWLVKNRLDDNNRIAAEIAVSSGWEAAVDRVLKQYISAVSASDLDAIDFTDLPDCELNVVARCNSDSGEQSESLSPLASKITAGGEWVEGLLSGVFVAENLQQAMRDRNLLKGSQVLITPDAEIIGGSWISIPDRGQTETGVLAREEEINRLSEKQQQLEQRLTEFESTISKCQSERDQLSQQLSSQRTQLTEVRAGGSALHNRFGREEAQHKEACDQIEKIKEELNSITGELSAGKKELENASALLATAEQESGTMEQKRQSLLEKRDEFSQQVAVIKQQLTEATENYHRQALAKEKLELEINATAENLNRLTHDRDQADARVESLRAGESDPGGQVQKLQAELEELLKRKIEVDNRFSSSADEAQSFEDKINQANSQREECSEHVNTAREASDQQRLLKQETTVRREALLDSIRQQDFSMEQCRAELPDDADLKAWEEKLTDTQNKVDRIGPVNLVAIDEFDEQSERMEYLEKQHNDLTEALETLEAVISKIDRETRTRFKQTFDQINSGFNEFFPKLFGGGNAELHLTDDDLLTAGVTVMARPPGKRNSHIHLLSGGEKALTAVAILFALFELNPAPFCMMDEVDAPLDDANVDRYCETLKTLAAKSQMIVITHNKITMAAMNSLVGVTMAEAGVSRLVSVDIEQAMEMAAQ